MAKKKNAAPLAQTHPLHHLWIWLAVVLMLSLGAVLFMKPLSLFKTQVTDPGNANGNIAESSYLFAIPTPCTIAPDSENCTSDIVWQGDPALGSMVQVMADSTLFACTGSEGEYSRTSPPLDENPVEFTLYTAENCDWNGRGSPLHSVVVQGNSAPPPPPSNENGSPSFSISQTKDLSALLESEDRGYGVLGAKNGLQFLPANPANASALIFDKVIFTVPAPDKGNLYGYRYYNLIDPLDPQKVTNLSYDLNTEDHPSGDFGSYAYLTGVGDTYSIDRRYAITVDNTRTRYLKKLPDNTLNNSPVMAPGASNPYLVQAGSKTFVFTPDGMIRDITGVPSGKGQGTITYNPLSPNMPQIGLGAKAILDPANGVIASLETGHYTFDRSGTGGTVPNDTGFTDEPISLRIYSLANESVLSTLPVPKLEPAVDRFKTHTVYFPVRTLKTADAQYIFVIGQLAHPSPSDPTAVDNLLFIYKVTGSSLQLLSGETDGIVLPEKKIISAVGMNLTRDAEEFPAIMVLELNSQNRAVPHIYLLSDLTEGTIRQSLNNPPALPWYGNAVNYLNPFLVALNQESSSYVYLSNYNQSNPASSQLKVWQINLTGSGVVASRASYEEDPGALPCIDRGDIDCNGEVAMQDLSLLIQYLEDPSLPPADAVALSNGDVTHCGVEERSLDALDEWDVQYYYHYLLYFDWPPECD